MIYLFCLLTWGARDCWAALIFSLLHDAVFPDWFYKGADPEEAHEHLVVAGTVEAGFVGHYLRPLVVVVVLVVTS